MIVLDTNVWSEPLRPTPDTSVLQWLRAHHDDGAITSVTVAELFYGAHLIPAGKRQLRLLSRIDRVVEAAGENLLTFDAASARTYGELRADAAQRGHPMTTEDAMIAAICRTHSCPLATRNTKGFEDMGIDLIDPWRYRPV